MTQWVEIINETDALHVPCQGMIELPVIQEGQCTTPVGVGVVAVAVAVAVANSTRTRTSLCRVRDRRDASTCQP